MVTYIKRTAPQIYVTFNEPLDPEMFSDLGNSYMDYLQGKWVELSEEQVAFHEQHPEASVLEVWNMQINEVSNERTLEQARFEKLMEIERYDTSEAVNQFTINEVIPAWFTPAERTNYALSINAAKLLGQQTLTFAVGGNVLQVETEKAEMMLSAVQLYADACYMVTMQHKMAVEALDTVEAVDAYDYTVSYPAHLNFNLV